MASGDSLSTIKQKMEALKKLQGEIQKLYALESSINELQFKQLEALEKQEDKIVAQIKAQAALNNSIKKQLEDFDEMDDTMNSIGNQMKKNSKFVKQQEIAFEAVKIVAESISEELKNGGVTTEKTQKQVVAVTDAYKSMHSSIADINREYSLGRISNEERIRAIQLQTDSFKDQMGVIDMTTISSKELKDVLESMGREGESFAEAMKQSQIQSERLDAVMGSFSGIPAMNEMNTLLKTNIRDTVAWKAAIFAVGAALGKAAYDYFGAPIKAAMQADKEISQSQIDTARDIAKIDSDAQFIPSKIAEERIKNEIEGSETVRKLNIDAAFAAQKAAIQFSASMQTGAAQFQRAAKTALFGKGIGSVGYGAAQMQLAGIGADKVASAMEAAGAATGKMPSAKVGADMAIMAERTGASVDNIASINEMFQRIDGASESTAMNMQEGLRTMADQVGIGLGELTKEMAEASKEMLGYQIKSGPALAKQVAYAKSLGVSFGDIAKAGKSMVLNYKDSIKAEMSLSSMLGKNVNLSEVRAKFMSGDQKGAMEALKAQGLDPESMNMFQQEQLSQALGGMDLSSLSKISKNTGKEGTLGAGNAKAGNQDFLSRTQSAEATLASQQAVISAKTAVIDAQLSKAIGDAYLNDPKYADYLAAQATAEKQTTALAGAMDQAFKNTTAYKNSIAQTSQLEQKSNAKNTLMEGAFSVAGGFGASLLNAGVGRLFGKKGGGGGGGNTPSGPSGPSNAPTGPDLSSTMPDISSVETPLQKAMTLGEKLKDFGKGIGGFLASVGKGVGDAIGGILQGLGKGLAALGTPQVLLGVVTMVGLGASLWVAGKGLQQFQGLEWETIGMAFVTLLGLGGVGAVLGTVAPFILAGAVAITAMSVAFAAFGLASGIAIPNLMQFQTLDAVALSSVGGGLVKLAEGLGAFGVGAVLAAVGKFFGGGTFDSLKDISGYASPIQQTADAVWSLSNAFGSLSSIDTSKLNDIPWGDMGEFAEQGGKFVLANSGGGSFALSKQTTTNIDKMSRKTEESFKELKFNSDIQNKMVGILVGNLEALQQIAINTAGDKQINLDGKRVNKSLLAGLQSNYGISRT